MDREQWRLALDDDGHAAKATTKRIRKLERELAREEKALAEVATLLVLKRKWRTYARKTRTATPTREREVILTVVSEAQAAGAHLDAA